MFYTYSAVCICSYRTLAILENASKGWGPWSALLPCGSRLWALSLTLPTWLHPSGLCQQLWKRQNSPQWGLDRETAVVSNDWECHVILPRGQDDTG